MTKEEILAKAREEGEDEGYYHAEYAGFTVANLAIFLTFVVLEMVGVIMSLDNNPATNWDNSGYMIMFCIYCICETYHKYKFDKNRVYFSLMVTQAVMVLVVIIRIGIKYYKAW